MRLPFVGARYERNWPTRWPARVAGLPVRVTVVDNATTYFCCPGVLIAWDLPYRPARFNLEQFLQWFHPIDNVVPFRP